MNGRQDRFNKTPSPWNNSWGQTTDENPTLLVHVRNIPTIATLDEYRQFFEKSGKVLGIHVTNFRAIIKFERPYQADHAISRTLEKFKGRELYIDKYRPSKNNGRQRPERSTLEQAMLGLSGPARHQKRSRSANRFSGSRSRSSSPSQRRHRQSSAFVNRSPPVQDTSVYGNSFKRIGIGRAPPPEQSLWLQQRESSLPELPTQIKLILNLMLTDNTARNLSFSQIQMLINFLNHEKEFAWGPPLEQITAQPEQQQQQPIEVDQPSNHEPTNGSPQEAQADANMARDEPEPYDSEEEEEEINEDQKIMEMLAEATGRG